MYNQIQDVLQRYHRGLITGLQAGDQIADIALQHGQVALAFQIVLCPEHFSDDEQERLNQEKDDDIIPVPAKPKSGILLNAIIRRDHELAFNELDAIHFKNNCMDRELSEFLSSGSYEELEMNVESLRNYFDIVIDRNEPIERLYRAIKEDVYGYHTDLTKPIGGE